MLFLTNKYPSSIELIGYSCENGHLTHIKDCKLEDTKNKIWTWLLGGLNFQVEHHLFPTICHVHYRGISEIVRNTAKEYNLPYYTNRTFFSALKAHGKMLRMLGQKDCPEFVHV